EDVKRRGENVILLLDEPGLSLHGMAQADLLRYMEQELKPYHQVIYTTHSPFMVDPDHFERVRIVQDKSIDATEPPPKENDGTKVLTASLRCIRRQPVSTPRRTWLRYPSNVIYRAQLPRGRRPGGYALPQRHEQHP